jgi:hypothetical protein
MYQWLNIPKKVRGLMVSASSPASRSLPLKHFITLDEALAEQEGDFDGAITAYRKALPFAKTGQDAAYPHIGAALCLLQQDKVALAIPELKQGIAAPGCPPRAVAGQDGESLASENRALRHRLERQRRLRRRSAAR